MNIYKIYQGVIVDTVEKLQEDGSILSGLDLRAITVQPPRNPEHADVATNAAMVLSKQAAKSPLELAQLIADNLIENEWTEIVEVVEPGFVNIKVNDAFWSALLKFYNNDSRPFLENTGNNEKVLIEFVSANPTGPLHVGHVRGAIYGDVLANLMKAVGYDVSREYYVNDAGNQIQNLRESVNAVKDGIEIPEDGYHGAYIKELPTVNPELTVLEGIKTDLEDLGVVFDNYVHEMDMLVNTTNLQTAIEKLDKAGLVYKEDNGAVMFKSTALGDDKDRALTKADGHNTYFAGDVAYHLNKMHRGFNHMINIFGADHHGYVKRVEAAVIALADDEIILEFELFQLVHLMRDGQKARMAKRHANYVTLRDVLEEVGKDALRLLMLMQTNNKDINFDLNKAIEKTADNPVWYIKYAHARICSLVRFTMEHEEIRLAMSLLDEKLTQDFSDKEMAVAKMLSKWQYIAEGAAADREPHRIATYLNDLATTFHRLWADQRFIITEEPELTAARLNLALATKNVLVAGLEILGVTPMEKM